MPSLDGKIKMSKSSPMGNIELPEGLNVLKKKINRAVTGGRATLEEHRRLGAEVEKCMVFELLKQHLIGDDEELDIIYEEYKSGKLLSGELKQILIDKLNAFLKEHQKKREEAKKQLDQFIVKD